MGKTLNQAAYWDRMKKVMEETEDNSMNSQERFSGAAKSFRAKIGLSLAAAEI